LFISLWNKIKSLLSGNPQDTIDPFMIARKRAAKIGGWTGLAVSVMGSFAGGIILEMLFRTFCYLAEGDYLGFTLIGVFFACSPIPLIGAVAGAIAGRRSLKQDHFYQVDSGFPPPGLLAGSIAGLIVGTFPYLIILMINIYQSGNPFC